MELFTRFFKRKTAKRTVGSFERLDDRLVLTAGITSLGAAEQVATGGLGNVSLRDDGKYLVAWRDIGTIELDVYVQQRTFGGPNADTIQLNSTPGFNWRPYVDSGTDGSATVAWTTLDAVKAQRLTSKGTTDGPAISHATSGVSNITVTYAGDEHALAWSTKVDTWHYQRYGADGTPVFNSPIQWGAGEGNESFAADLGTNGNISMLAQNYGDGPSFHLYRYDASGQPIGTPIDVQTSQGLGRYPALEMSEDGSMLAGWASYTSNEDPLLDPTYHPIELQHFSPAGVAVGERVILGGEVEHFAMDVTDEGSYVVVWRDSDQLYMNAYNKRGRAALQTPLLVAADINGYAPSVAVNEQGQAVVAWGQGADVYAGMYEIEYPSDITFAGTSGADVVVLQLGETEHLLSINGGAANRYDATQVETFKLQGGNAADTLIIRGTDGHDIASADGDSGVISFQHGQRNYKVSASGFEQVTLDGGGGPDRALLYGSSDAQKHDHLTGLPQSAGGSRLQAGYTATPADADYTFQAQNFTRVDSFGRGGAADLASVYGTDGNDQFFRFSDYEVLVGEGMIQKTKGFSRVDAFGRGGNDSTFLTDSSGSDAFFSFPQFAVLVLGNSQDRVLVKGFENVRAVSNQGGTDSGYLRQIRSADLLFAADASALLLRSGQQETLFGYDMVSAEPDDGQRPGKSVEQDLPGLTTTGSWYDI